MAHPILGRRLIECTELVNSIHNCPAQQIFGSPDDLKVHSSMTLFWLGAPDERAFSVALGKYFGGISDRRTADYFGSSRTIS